MTNIAPKVDDTRDLRDFLSLYQNFHYPIVGRPNPANPVKTCWVTDKRLTVTPKTIVDSVTGNSKSLLGLGCNEKQSHAIIDIDIDSPYHTHEWLNTFRSQCSKVGLSFRQFISSYSGGWHLYFYFTEKVDSTELSTKLKYWLTTLGYKIANGELEVFPDGGKRFRLPLQTGFSFAEIEIPLDIPTFMGILKSSINDWSKIALEAPPCPSKPCEIVKVGNPSLRPLNRAYKTVQKPMVNSRWNTGKMFYKYGLSGPSQSHAARLAVGYYLLCGDRDAGILPIHDADMRTEAIYQWFLSHNNGFCKDIQHHNLAGLYRAVSSACHWSPGGGSYTPPPRYTDRFKKVNQERHETSWSNIRSAYEELRAESPGFISDRDIAKRANASTRTVKQFRLTYDAHNSDREHVEAAVEVKTPRLQVVNDNVRVLIPDLITTEHSNVIYPDYWSDVKIAVRSTDTG